MNSDWYHWLMHDWVLISLFCGVLVDHHGNPAGKAIAEGHRSPSQWHHQAGKQHSRATWHVHGHGHAGGEPGNWQAPFPSPHTHRQPLLHCVSSWRRLQMLLSCLCGTFSGSICKPGLGSMMWSVCGLKPLYFHYFIYIGACLYGLFMVSLEHGMASWQELIKSSWNGGCSAVFTVYVWVVMYVLKNVVQLNEAMDSTLLIPWGNDWRLCLSHEWGNQSLLQSPIASAVLCCKHWIMGCIIESDISWSEEGKLVSVLMQAFSAM